MKPENREILRVFTQTKDEESDFSLQVWDDLSRGKMGGDSVAAGILEEE